MIFSFVLLPLVLLAQRLAATEAESSRLGELSSLDMRLPVTSMNAVFGVENSLPSLVTEELDEATENLIWMHYESVKFVDDLTYNVTITALHRGYYELKVNISVLHEIVFFVVSEENDKKDEVIAYAWKQCLCDYEWHYLNFSVSDHFVDISADNSLHYSTLSLAVDDDYVLKSIRLDEDFPQNSMKFSIEENKEDMSIDLQQFDLVDHLSRKFINCVYFGGDFDSCYHEMDGKSCRDVELMVKWIPTDYGDNDEATMQLRVVKRFLHNLQHNKHGLEFANREIELVISKGMSIIAGLVENRADGWSNDYHYNWEKLQFLAENYHSPERLWSGDPECGPASVQLLDQTILYCLDFLFEESIRDMIFMASTGIKQDWKQWHDFNEMMWNQYELQIEKTYCDSEGMQNMSAETKTKGPRYQTPLGSNLHVKYNMAGLRADKFYDKRGRLPLVSKSTVPRVRYGSFGIFETSATAIGFGTIGSFYTQRSAGTCLHKNLGVVEDGYLNAFVTGNKRAERQELLKWRDSSYRNNPDERFYFNLYYIGHLERSEAEGRVDCALVRLQRGAKVNSSWLLPTKEAKELEQTQGMYMMQVPFTHKWIKLYSYGCDPKQSMYARCFDVAAEDTAHAKKWLIQGSSGTRIHDGSSRASLMFATGGYIPSIGKYRVYAVNETGCTFLPSLTQYVDPTAHELNWFDSSVQAVVDFVNAPLGWIASLF